MPARVRASSAIGITIAALAFAGAGAAGATAVGRPDGFGVDGRLAAKAT
jgi:hypothetical protein